MLQAGKPRKILVSIATLGLSASLLLAGCGSTGTNAPAPPKENNQSSTPSKPSPSQASPTTMETVVVGDKKAPSGAGIILGEQLGFFKQQGIEIKFQGFKSGADQLQALATGQIDVGRTVLDAGVFNATNRGINIKLVADGGQNIPGKSYFSLVIKKELADKIKDYKDLKGLKIGIASSGSINQSMAVKALEKGGLTGKDVKWVVVNSFPDLTAAVANGAVDAAMQIEPLITAGVEKGIFVRWKDATEYAPNEAVSVLEFSPQFAAKKDLANRFMTAYIQGIRAWDDAMVYGSKDKDQIVSIMSKETGVTPEVFTKMSPPLLDPNGKFPVDSVISDLDWYVKEGLVKDATDVKKMIDESYAQAVVAKIGEYKKP